MSSQLLTFEQVADRINAGRPLLLAGDESLLSGLPPGNWIGGTIPYFMTPTGGCMCKDRIFATELPDYACEPRALSFDRAALPSINADADPRDISVIILPAGSGAHADFALDAPSHEGFASHPVIGWISGVDLADLGSATPKVFCGNSTPLEDDAAVLRFRLPENKFANINIVNLFRQGDGDVIRFPKDGFSADQAVINGQPCSFAEYLLKIEADTKLPLVADYNGTSINVSFKSVDPSAGNVELYAPVWRDIDYKLAAPIGDYVAGFEARLKELSPESIVFSCNCILNYLYSELEGRQTGGVSGPVTFGEVAYQLLNQTMAYITIEDLN